MKKYRVLGTKALLAEMTGLLAVVRDCQTGVIAHGMVPWAKWEKDADICLEQARKILKSSQAEAR